MKSLLPLGDQVLLCITAPLPPLQQMPLTSARLAQNHEIASPNPGVPVEFPNSPTLLQLIVGLHIAFVF